MFASGARYRRGVEQMTRSQDLPCRKWPRLRGFGYPASYAYSVTICTRDREGFFAHARTAAEVARCLEEQAEACGYRIVAYCVMPDHVHILTGPNPKDGSPPLPTFIQRFKSVSTRSLWALGVIGKVWQASYYDHVIREEEDIAEVARYILGNPVRRGLVDSPEKYPFARLFLGDGSPTSSPAP